MKNKILYCFLVLSMVTLLNSCKDDDNDSSSKSTSTTDTGVVINGVTWATRNVNTPGYFTNSPEDYGYFYQWNSNLGWPATGSIGSMVATDDSTKSWSSSWNGGFTTGSTSDTVATANDPSPAGWRIPTKVEMATLLDTAKVKSTWTTLKGVTGRTFTDRTTGNSIFLPAAGSYDYNGGRSSAGTSGRYWTSRTNNSADAYILFFYNAGLPDARLYYRAYLLTIRPVAK
jgi:uncharacterized protein (TIGR02145 family)